MKNQEKKQRDQRSNKTDGRVKGECYVYINSLGNIEGAIDTFGSIDNHRYETGNYFETEEDAGEYIEKTKIYMELKRLAERLNNGEKIDWKNKAQKKYFICYDNTSNRLVFDFYSTLSFIGTIYCLDENFLDIALERIGKERLEKLFKE